MTSSQDFTTGRKDCAAVAVVARCDADGNVSYQVDTGDDEVPVGGKKKSKNTDASSVSEDAAVTDLPPRATPARRRECIAQIPIEVFQVVVSFCGRVEKARCLRVCTVWTHMTRLAVPHFAPPMMMVVGGCNTTTRFTSGLGHPPPAIEAISAMDFESHPQLPSDAAERDDHPLTPLRGRTFAATCMFDNTGYVLGGRAHPEMRPTDDAFAIEAKETLQIERLPPMPFPRSGAACTALNGIVYVIGGTDGSTASDVVQQFCLLSQEWTVGPPLPKASIRAAATAAHGYVYVVGGSGEGTQFMRFKPSRGVWERLPPPPHTQTITTASGGAQHITNTCLLSPALTVAFGRFLVVAGGTIDRKAVSSVYVWDLFAERWTRGSPLSKPRANPTLTFTEDGQLVIAGGFFAGPLNSVERVQLRAVDDDIVFDSEWEKATPLKLRRDGCRVLLYD